VPEASRLIGISQARLRRWLRGYTYATGEGRVVPQPVWRRQLPAIEGTLGLGFLDLMEARFIDAFRKADIPWRVVRLCAERARELCRTDHPFSTQRFRTDGRTIFAETIGQTGGSQLLDLVISRFAFARVIAPSLYAGIEFSDRDVPVRWWPLGRQTSVVIDPARSFGQPIVSDGGVPTAVLADAVATEGSIAKVARLYEVPPQEVHAALRFEQRLAERLAA
jgi:uncharacterized protein (DUF433 family)